LRNAINESQIVDSNDEPIPSITISAGLAARRAGETAEDLLKRADQALYLAKAQGRDRLETGD